MSSSIPSLTLRWSMDPHVLFYRIRGHQSPTTDGALLQGVFGSSATGLQLRPGAWCIVSDSMIRDSDSSAAWKYRDFFTLPQRCESF